MKVLFIDNYPAPYRIDLYNLIAEQVDLTVVYGVRNDKTRDKGYTNDNVKFNRVFLEGIRVGTTSNITFKITKLIKNGNFDVIIVGGFSSPMFVIAMKYMLRHNIPFLLNADGGFVNEDENKLKHKIKYNLISKATAWMTSGKATDKYLVNYGAKEENIYHYPFAFNFSNERYLPSEEEKIKLKEKVGIKEKKNILFIGRMVGWKRVDKTLLAFSKIKGDVGLYFVGVNELSSEYQQIVDENNIKNVHCLGFKKGQDLKDCYLASDMFVLPSHHEVWGLVVNEALTNSCPTITTDTCNSGLELIKNGYNGVIIETDNDEQLYESMQKILDDDEFRMKLAKNSFESIKDFNIENNAKKHVEIVNDFYNKFVRK